MVLSRYILDILDLAFDGHPHCSLLRQQVPLLAIAAIEHTGIGVYLYFSANNQIEPFRIKSSFSRNGAFDGTCSEMITGVEIQNPDLYILADATVHLKNGLIDHLEIWNKCGEDYVQTAPLHYRLDQKWLGESQKRSIIR